MAKTRGSQATLEALFGSSPPTEHTKAEPATENLESKTKVGVRIIDDRLQIQDSLPNPTIKKQVEARFMEKLQRQKDTAKEVEAILMPYYIQQSVTKEEYKAIFWRIVPRLSRKTGENK